MKVKQFYNKNQFVIKDTEQGATHFQSYDSHIAEYKSPTNSVGRVSDRLILTGDMWNYSTTTSKHFYLFLEDYCGIYLTSKNKRKEFAGMIEKGKAENGVKIEYKGGRA